jgi:hypothetical protein
MPLRSLGIACVVTGSAVLAAVGVPRGGQAPGAPPPLQALLESAATYLDNYEHQFAAIVSDETYAMSRRRNGLERNVLRSDLVLLSPAEGDWLEFRDVYEVNGRPVRDHDQRLQALFEKPPADALARARQIADESARYNLGVTRNFNLPTMALGYLSRHNQPGSKFSVTGSRQIDDVSTVEVSFRETERPTKIQSAGRDTVTTGRFWIRAASGEVLETELKCVAFAGSATGTVTVKYALEPHLKVLVPGTMDEQYTLALEADAGHATYANFRQFAVDTKAVIGHTGGSNGP